MFTKPVEIGPISRVVQGHVTVIVEISTVHSSDATHAIICRDRTNTNLDPTRFIFLLIFVIHVELAYVHTLRRCRSPYFFLSMLLLKSTEIFARWIISSSRAIMAHFLRILGGANGA